ncbi:hypothetical protein [Microbulbifer sp. SAOS-129_SWC]|uniref:hypothetical protein n=1 Tax=Microbulbifer sp. SAOS-129_SWC TaxID=3145235 RepID=UPI003216AC83
MQRVSLGALESELKLKLKKIEADAGSVSQKARVVIEAVLVWEFGDKVRNEPKFNLLIAKVHQHLESDSRIKAALENFLEQLAS